jgi:hypothetical protein
MALSILYNPLPTRLFEADGDFAAGAKAYFYLARTSTPLTVYTDAPMTAAHTWPVVADAFGLLPPIYIEKGEEYKVRIEDALGSILYAADGISNPDDVTVEGGGEVGVVVTADEIFQTGDVMWNPAGGPRAGWVRCNGRTISKASGSGTESNNDDCHDLFVFLWNNFSDALCPVTPGGRGGNAEADWGLAKAIATLDMRGRSAVGLDDMGNSAANLIQVATTINTTNASAAATVASTTGLAAGMFVIAAGVTAGTKIVSVTSATAITLSANATATATGVAARFSIFSDAQTAGAGGGENTHVLLASEDAKEIFIDPSGQSNVDIAVPAWARHVEIEGSCYMPTGTICLMQVSGDGTTFGTAYTVSGPFHGTGSGGFATYPPATSGTIALTLNSDEPLVPHNFMAFMALTRPTAAHFITCKSYSIDYATGAAFGYRTSWLQSSISSSTFSDLAIKILRFLGPFTTGSSIVLRWAGKDTQAMVATQATLDTQAGGAGQLALPEAEEGAAVAVPSGGPALRVAGEWEKAVNLQTPARLGSWFSKK